MMYQLLVFFGESRRATEKQGEKRENTPRRRPKPTKHKGKDKEQARRQREQQRSVLKVGSSCETLSEDRPIRRGLVASDALEKGVDFDQRAKLISKLFESINTQHISVYL